MASILLGFYVISEHWVSQNCDFKKEWKKITFVVWAVSMNIFLDLGLFKHIKMFCDLYKCTVAVKVCFRLLFWVLRLKSCFHPSSFQLWLAPLYPVNKRIPSGWCMKPNALLAFCYTFHMSVKRCNLDFFFWPGQLPPNDYFIPYRSMAWQTVTL